MLKKKPQIENRKDTAEKQLATWVDKLKSKGLSDAQIQRDSQVRHYQAKVRQANYQLSVIAKNEALEARKAETKAKKAAAEKEAPAKSKKSAADSGQKKAKKEKKAAAAKAPQAGKKKKK
jgi:hypothetical protein